MEHIDLLRPSLRPPPNTKIDAQGDVHPGNTGATIGQGSYEGEMTAGDDVGADFESKVGDECDLGEASVGEPGGFTRNRKSGRVEEIVDWIPGHFAVFAMAPENPVPLLVGKIIEIAEGGG